MGHSILNIFPFKAKNDDVINYVIFTASIKNTFSSVVQRFLDSYPEIWHDGGNRDDQLMFDIEIENKAFIDHFDDVIILSRYASNLQKPIFSGPYGLSQWYLAFGDIFYCLLVTLHQKGKKRVMDQVMMTSSI